MQIHKWSMESAISCVAALRGELIVMLLNLIYVRYGYEERIKYEKDINNIILCHFFCRVPCFVGSLARSVLI